MKGSKRKGSIFYYIERGSCRQQGEKAIEEPRERITRVDVQS